MATRTQAVRIVKNDYRCSIERNQGGKYCIRIQVHYPRHAWNLGVYFLASSFDRAMKKLEEGLDFLQRNEEKLWFWGVDRAEDLGFSAEFLKEALLIEARGPIRVRVGGKHPGIPTGNRQSSVDRQAGLLTQEPDVHIRNVPPLPQMREPSKATDPGSVLTSRPSW